MQTIMGSRIDMIDLDTLDAKGVVECFLFGCEEPKKLHLSQLAWGTLPQELRNDIGNKLGELRMRAARS